MTKQKQITVLVRYEMKQDCPERGLHRGDVVLHIENSTGKRYYTTLRRNKAHSCSCTGNAEYGRTCYHIKDMTELQNTRYAAAKLAKAPKVVEMPAQEPHLPVAMELPEDLKGRGKVAKSVDISTRGNLNGNKPFSILKIA